MFKASLASLFLLLVPALLLARSDDDFRPASQEELQMKSVAVAPGAPAAILEWTHRQDDLEATETEYFRVKIFRDEGKKYGDVSIEYVPGFSNIGAIKARTIRPDGAIVEFNGKIYDKLLVRYGATKLMAKTFTLPEVQPGSILEYRYRRSWSIGIVATSRWIVAHQLPVLHETLWLKPIQTRQVSSYLVFANLPQNKAPLLVKDHYELVLENLPPLDDEPFSPPEQQTAPRIDFFYTTGSADANVFWTREGKGWAESIEGFIGNGRGIRTEAQTLIAGATTPEEKLRRIYARVQKIRNLSFETEKTVQEESRSTLSDNNHAEDVLNHGYGHSSEINRFFIALARAAGMDANAVRVARRDKYFFAKQITDGEQLNGEVAMVMLDGTPRFFDPGTPCAPFGILSWESTNVVGMKIAKDGGTFVETPLPPAKDALLQRKASLRLDGETLGGTVVVTWNGEEALMLRRSGWNDDEAANRKSIEELIKKWLPEGSTVTLTKVSGLRAVDEPLVAELDVQLANVGSLVGSRFLLPLSLFASRQKNPFAAEQRRMPVYFSYPHQTEDEVTLELPAGYSVESIPGPLNVDFGAAKFTNRYAAKDNMLTLSRTLGVGAVMIDLERYSVIRAFYSKVSGADQETVVLKKQQAVSAQKVDG